MAQTPKVQVPPPKKTQQTPGIRRFQVVSRPHPHGTRWLIRGRSTVGRESRPEAWKVEGKPQKWLHPAPHQQHPSYSNKKIQKMHDFKLEIRSSVSSSSYFISISKGQNRNTPGIPISSVPLAARTPSESPWSLFHQVKNAIRDVSAIYLYKLITKWHISPGMRPYVQLGILQSVDSKFKNVSVKI